jgi:hypothetical protein
MGTTRTTLVIVLRPRDIHTFHLADTLDEGVGLPHRVLKEGEGPLHRWGGTGD